MRLGINGRFYRAGVTGVQRFARELTTRLVERADVTMLLPADARMPGTTQCRIARGRLSGHAWEQLELPRVARQHGCDVTLHLSGTAPLQGGPHVVVIHDVLPLTHPQFFSRRFAHLYRTVLGRVVPRAAAVITVSDASAAAIERVLRPVSDVHVVTQGLDPFARPATAESIDAARAEYALESPWLLACGHGDPRKNLSFLGRVMAELVNRDRRMRLVVTGSPATRVHGRVETSYPTDTVLTGYVSDETMLSLYSGAAVLLFPSVAEGFGRPPLEAQACGTPAIVADVDGIPAAVRAAAWPLPLDPSQWANAIIELIDDSRVRTARIEQGRGFRAGMSWDRCAARVLSICEEAVAARHERAAASTTS